jgi:glycosyltransferase involved in cell wall biosynthesis
MTTPVPLLTVAIPTYKGAAFIGAAIESVLAQTFRDFELLVIDDNSPDDTEAIVRRFVDPRIRYLRNSANLGPQGNWNRCLTEARGALFKLLPHDDLLMPTCLQRQVDALQADRAERYALVACARDVLGPTDRVLTRRGYPGGREGLIDGGEVMRSCVRRGTNLLGEPGAIMFRKSLADRVGPFDGSEGYVIDLDYWFRLLAHGDVYFIAEALSAFRVSNGSWSVAIGNAQDREFVDFVRRISHNFRPPLSALDLFAARVSAKLNMWLRLAFYTLYLRKAP